MDDRPWAKGHELDIQLLEAARDGTLSDVRKLIKQGADVNYTHPTGFTPLVQALSRNKIDIMQELIDNGARTTAANGLPYFNLPSAKNKPEARKILEQAPIVQATRKKFRDRTIRNALGIRLNQEDAPGLNQAIETVLQMEGDIPSAKRVARPADTSRKEREFIAKRNAEINALAGQGRRRRKTRRRNKRRV